MLQQASFYASMFPAGTTFGPAGDADAFYLPATNAKFGNPVEGGAEFPVAFSTKPAVGAVQAYFSSPVYATARAAAGGWTSANTGVPIDTYKDPVLKAVAMQLQNKSGAIVFDASDLMPSAVNGAFWKEITKYYAEGKSMKDVAAAIDANW
jgi:alpha-glucoside transport system substrate-binding protein